MVRQHMVKMGMGTDEEHQKFGFLIAMEFGCQWIIFEGKIKRTRVLKKANEAILPIFGSTQSWIQLVDPLEVLH